MSSLRSSCSPLLLPAASDSVWSLTLTRTPVTEPPWLLNPSKHHIEKVIGACFLSRCSVGGDRINMSRGSLCLNLLLLLVALLVLLVGSLVGLLVTQLARESVPS